MSRFDHWTPERLAEFRKLWDQGLTASQISERFGGVVSRGAVLGKARRLGLPKRNTGRVKAAAKTAAKTAGVKKLRPRGAAVSVSAPASMAGAMTAPCLPPVADGALSNGRPRSATSLVSIHNLTNRTCRWPVGDPQDSDFGYCGAECATTEAYCKTHAAIAYSRPHEYQQGRYSQSERDFIVDHWQNGTGLAHIATHLNRKPSSVKMIAQRELGLGEQDRADEKAVA